MDIQISKKEEEHILNNLKKRTDAEAARMKRYLTMPDLSRTPNHPLAEIVRRVKQIPALKDFDDIEIPEIVPASISFDLFDFPEDHPARSTSDTYYANEDNILRTHDTVFWYYYLQEPEIQKRIENKESFGAICYGKVYRKDEIDRRHMNVFHQIGGWYLTPDEKEVLTLDDLKEVLSEIVRSIFGADAEYRFNEDVFPYTDPSLEVEVKVGDPSSPSGQDEWVEILGGGMPKKSVLKKMGVENYNGWAFGFGIERLAIISMELPDIRLLWSKDKRVTKQLTLGQKFEEVSKYPPAPRDISFIVKKETFVPNNYFDLVRDLADDLVEEVELIDTYEDKEKFGEGMKSYTYRIIYRSVDRTLTNEEVDELHTKIEDETKKQFDATIR